MKFYKNVDIIKKALSTVHVIFVCSTQLCFVMKKKEITESLQLILRKYLLFFFKCTESI